MSLSVPVIQLAGWLAGTLGDAEKAELAATVADSFVRYGVLVVRDPRVSEDDNNRFTDLMEQYYDQPDEVKARDARPDLHYQVGATPEATEVPRCRFDPRCEDIFKSQTPENKVC